MAGPRPPRVPRPRPVQPDWVTATGADGAPVEGVTPTITGGSAVLRATADGQLLVEDLDVTLDDIVVPAGELGPAPLHLTDVSLHLGTQIAVDAAWAPSGESVAGSGTGDLLLDWSLVLDDGSPYQLATQKLAERPFQVAVREDATGKLTAAVTMSADGELRQFADRVTLSDLSLAVVAIRPGVVTIPLTRRARGAAAGARPRRGQS